MSDLVSNSAGLNLELELRPMESIPLAQVREGAEALLNMDVSDDLMPLGIQAGEKPAVPAGAEELVFFYEKQLAATQLVQHRLEKQYNQLVEEKVALETSLSVQTSALQQQLVLAREKAERAFAQAEHAQQKVHGAHAAVGEIVDAVTHLAALLDVSGVTKELTQSFETVARSTQRTFQAVEAAREGAKLVLELQMDAKNTCHVSPLLTAMSSGSHGTDTARRLEEDALRLHKELDDAKRREQELEAEMRAAQLLFSGLEAEVVSLQHDQAQAAAKLQLSQEELLSARDELMIAQQALSSAQSPAAGALTQGLSKLDAHILSVRNFLEGLSMPQSPGILDAIGGSTLQLRGARRDEGNVVAHTPVASDDARASMESGGFLRQLGVSPQQQLRALLAAASDDLSAPSFFRWIARKAHDQGQVGDELVSTPEEQGVVDERQGAFRQQLHDSNADLSEQIAAVVTGRDVLRGRAAELASRINSLEIEKEGLFHDRSQQLSMAAAAGAAAAIVIATDASARITSSSQSQSPSAIVAAADPATFAMGMSNMVFSALEERLTGLEAALAVMTAERDAALQRADSLEDELESLHDLLGQGAERRDGTYRLLEHRRSMRGTASGRKNSKLDTFTPTADLAAVTEDLSAAKYPDVPLAESPGSPTSRQSPGHSLSHRSDTSIVSDSHLVGEAADLFSEQDEPVREMSRACTRSSTAVQSSYQSFTSEAPLVPTRRYTDDSQPHTYPLDPTEPLEELLPGAAVGGSTLSIRGGDIGVTRETCRDTRRSCGNIHGGHDTQSLMIEVKQLQAAICSLLISKAVACTELEVESERAIAALQGAHHAEMAKLREEHLADIAQLQALVTVPVDVFTSAPPPQNSVVQWSDKSTNVSEDGLPGVQYEAELLHNSVSLEMRILEMEEVRHQLIASYEERLRRMQAEIDSRLSCAVPSLQKMEVGGDSRSVDENYGTELQDKERQPADCFLPSIHELIECHEDERLRLKLAHKEELAKLRREVQWHGEQHVADYEAAQTELKSLKQQVSELRDQLARQLVEHEMTLATMERQKEETNIHRAVTEDLQRSLEDCEGELLLRESLISELRGQIQQIQSDKEVEEQSLQSLLSTKAWMMDEIRSLQAELKEATAKLASAKSDLKAFKAAGISTGLSNNDMRLDNAGTAQPLAENNGMARGTTSSARVVASPTAVVDEAHVCTAVTTAADQLAEAAMQTALAEAQLEALQHQAAMDSTPTIRQSLNGHDMERTNLMMETVVLQGELDELRTKHNAAQSIIEAVADELAYAVMRASLAELQLEHLRLERVGDVVVASTSLRPKQQSGSHTHHALPSADMSSHVAFTPSKPAEFLSGVDAPECFGTEAFIPTQQARQLYKELRIVRRALGEVMLTDAVVNCSKSREALTSILETAISAQDRAASLARTLMQQQKQKTVTADVPFEPMSGDEQQMNTDFEQPLTSSCLNVEMARVRDAYCDAAEVYEMLRSDAEDITNQLWRWSVRLGHQLVAKEAELTRVQVELIPGSQLAFESLLSRKEAYIRSIEGQVSELQADLQAAHSQLLRRAGQVATLQDMMVQLSEQITAFEDVVVRCEVLSADLLGHPGARCA